VWIVLCVTLWFWSQGVDCVMCYVVVLEPECGLRYVLRCGSGARVWTALCVPLWFWSQSVDCVMSSVVVLRPECGLLNV
jgi:hypothetical protein